GGFGLLNYQAINKPAFYSYKFMNKLGDTELKNTDSSSWACKDEKGNVQVLLWDFTFTLPDSVNNQEYYVRDLPAKSKGKVKINLSEIPAGVYNLEIYKVGYRVNDSYTTYFDMGRPSQLTKEQVKKIKGLNNGSAISNEKIEIKTGLPFIKELDIRENDVFLITMMKQ
ncbi:MAG: glycoside hydrolase, partial [Ignavibacteria bacterium]|nr:glycoside hydrolase [Ignavibacteria bacterium]